jgi:hypothetical protein
MRWSRRSQGLVLAVVATLPSFGCNHWGGVAMSLASPGKTYHVDLVGRLDKPNTFLDEHYVLLTAHRREHVVAADFEIHFADWFDEGFDREYEAPSWPKENVLRFGGHSPTRHGILRVRNASSRALSLLKVRADADLFLFFDLAPGSLTSVATSERAPSTGPMYVGVDGEWAGGAFMDGDGGDFDVSQIASHCAYDVLVDDPGVSITQGSCGR